MGKIIILDENTANKIAAGEVIERPASVIKELVENSIDAGSTKISVEIKNGGISYIKISDNGSGILKDDVRLAFERHGTSKIVSADDIQNVITMGFRGEALASIAAVADVTMTTATKNEPVGTFINVKAGKVTDETDAGCPTGTVIVIRDLFFNTPARYKFLKSDSTEARYINDIMTRIALARPDISFTLTDTGKEVFRTPGDNSVTGAVYSVYGKEISRSITEVNYKDEYCEISGYCGKADIASGNRNRQSFYVNKRYIKSKILTTALEQAYKTLLMKNRYPFAVLYVNVNCELVDVNVHPTKTEVRFSDEQALFRSVYHAVSNAVIQGSYRTGILNVNEAGDRDKKPDISHIKTGSTVIKENTSAVNTYGKKHDGLSSDIKNIRPYNQTPITPIQTGCSGGSENKRKRTDLNGINSTMSIQELNYSNVVKPLNMVSAVATTPETDCADADISIEKEELKKAVNKDQGLLGETSVYTKEQNINIPGNENRRTADNDYEPELSGINSLVLNYKIIGSVFDTYIIIQQGDNLYMIDQHAAHERTIYEKLLTRVRDGKKTAAQILLNPQIVDLSDEDMSLLETYRQELEYAGYLFEDFGGNTVILREVPYMAVDDSPKEMFIDAVNILDKSKGMDIPSVRDELLYGIACKAAVKANKKLSDQEIEALINELVDLHEPKTCPHGRPLYITVNKKDLEKMFKRIV